MNQEGLETEHIMGHSYARRTVTTITQRFHKGCYEK